MISAMGNMPIVKDLVVDMEPFWSKFRSVGPWLQPGYDVPEDGKETAVAPERMNHVHKEALCINCGCCVSECNSMESDPEFLGPQALAKGIRFVGDPRDAAGSERLDSLNGEHGIWDCTRCYFCNERCPKGVDPRDAIAKLGAESMKLGIDRDMGAKHAKWFVISAKTTGWLRETELVPKTQGIVSAIKQTKFAIDLARHGKVPPPFPPHVAKDVKEARGLYDIVRTAAAAAQRGSSRASARSPTSAMRGRRRADPYGEGSFPRPYLPGEDKGQVPGGAERGPGLAHAGRRDTGRRADEEAGRGRLMPRVAYYKGCLASLSAKELDISTQALAPQLSNTLCVVAGSRVEEDGACAWETEWCVGA